jgi:ribosome biogenesis protein Nip4
MADALLDADDESHQKAHYKIPKLARASSPKQPEPDSDLEEGELEGMVKQFEVERVKGPLINSKLSKFVESAFFRPNEAKVSDITEKTVKPENLEVKVQKINPVIWDKINPQTQIVDAKLQHTLADQMKVTYLLVETMQNMHAAKQTEYMMPLMEAVALLGSAGHKINLNRKNLIQKQLNPKFRAAVNSVGVEDNGKSEYLFGDKIPETVKLMEDSAKLKENLGKFTKSTFRPQSFRPYNEVRQQYRETATKPRQEYYKQNSGSKNYRANQDRSNRYVKRPAGRGSPRYSHTQRRH